MKTSTNRAVLFRILDRALIGALLLAGVQLARAAEIIPAIGLTHTVDGGQNRAFGSLALRAGVAPMLKGELGLAYRSEEMNGGDLKVKSWPVTASLWLSPLPTLYAGGGVGWYNTTLDYKETLPFKDETSRKFGVHLGGGFQIPLGPLAALDLSGRYVFLDKQKSQLPPNEFDPDYWSTSVGLAIKF